MGRPTTDEQRARISGKQGLALEILISAIDEERKPIKETLTPEEDSRLESLLGRKGLEADDKREKVRLLGRRAKYSNKMLAKERAHNFLLSEMTANKALREFWCAVAGVDPEWLQLQIIKKKRQLPINQP